MPSKYRKPRTIKQKKSILKNRFFWLGLLAILVAAALLYGFFFSGVFVVNTIEVEGARKVDQQVLSSMVEESIQKTFLGMNMNHLFLISTGKIQEDVQARFPVIREVEIQKKLFHSLLISIIERRGVAILCQTPESLQADKTCLALDSEGILFEEREVSDFLPLITYSEERETAIGEKIIEGTLLKTIVDFYGEFKGYILFQETDLYLQEFEILSESRIHIHLSEGWQAYIDPEEDIQWQADKLKTVLSKSIPEERRPYLEYIDLRFGDQAFVQYSD